jgi:hypothetical protein
MFSRRELMDRVRTHLFTRLLALAWMLCAASCTGDATHIEEDAFELSLPGQWNGGYDARSRVWIYLTPSGEEGVTVSVLLRPAGAAASTLESDFDRYLEMRRRQEQQLSDEPIAFTEPKVSRERNRITAVFDGLGKTSQRRTRTLLVVNEVAAGSFYFEAFGLSEQAFTARAGVVLSRASLSR